MIEPERLGSGPSTSSITAYYLNDIALNTTTADPGIKPVVKPVEPALLQHPAGKPGWPDPTASQEQIRAVNTAIGQRDTRMQAKLAGKPQQFTPPMIAGGAGVGTAAPIYDTGAGVEEVLPQGRGTMARDAVVANVGGVNASINPQVFGRYAVAPNGEQTQPTQQAQQGQQTTPPPAAAAGPVPPVPGMVLGADRLGNPAWLNPTLGTIIPIPRTP